MRARWLRNATLAVLAGTALAAAAAGLPTRATAASAPTAAGAITPGSTSTAAPETATSFLGAVFQRRYEDAAALLAAPPARPDALFDRWEAWNREYFEPRDVRVVSTSEAGAGRTRVGVTFSFKTATGVNGIRRLSIDLVEAKGRIAVAEFPARSEATGAPSAGPAAGGAAPSMAVTIPENGPAAGPGGSPLANMILQSALSGGSTAGLPSAGGSASIQNLMPMAMSMMSDPEVMEMVSDPKIQALVNDPAFVQAALSGNLGSIASDPRLQGLMGDPRVLRILQKYGSGAPPAGGGSGPGMTDVFDAIKKSVDQ